MRSTLSSAEEIRSAMQNLAQIAAELRQATGFFQIEGEQPKTKAAKTASHRLIGR